MRRTGRSRLVAAVLVTAITLASSACASMSINRVLADPSRYNNREVKLSGSVVDSVSVANRGAYRIEDGTGELWVVSENGTPRKGARVSVTGTVREAFNLGSLGEQIKVPGLGAGLVLIESSHKAK